MSEIFLVFCTCPDRPAALDLAKILVESGLAACVTIQDGVTSVYLWQGALEQSDECLLLIKTSAARYQELEDAIKARHPYELPEIIAVPIQTGLNDYLTWVEQCTKAPH